MDETTVKKIKEKYLIPLSENEVLKTRLINDSKDRDRDDGEFQRDYTRILYSSSFRRLQGKMQLLGLKKDQFFRNRLTHSLEVAQIARSIANKLEYTKEESYIVEAGALAHDIGNPPYGHAGERALNVLAKEFGGFEGNAQTLRILTTVEQKRSDYRGLNLTYRTLLSVVKYNNIFNKNLNKQKFLYQNDFEFIGNIEQDSGICARTLDVQIVDIADEIAYAAHDLEDGLRQGLFSTDEILHDFYNLYHDEDTTRLLEDIFEKSKERASFKQINMDSSQYSKLYRKELVSRIIHTLIHDIGLVKLDDDYIKKTGTKNKEELGFTKLGKLASGLKQTTYNCINHNDEVYVYEDKGEEILNCLYEFYSKSEHYHYLPPEYRAEIIVKQYGLGNPDKNFQERLIIDYISGMMDAYTETTYKKLTELKNG